MELSAILASLFFLLVLSASHVESARRAKQPYSMFVFGDSYVDTGNLPKSEISELSRQWYWPYGSAASIWGPSGRFSDAFVQSDLIAMMMGRPESPPAYRRIGNYNHPLGLNFATGGTGVYKSVNDGLTLHRQISHFRDMVQRGFITPEQLSVSVALVAISGSDYDDATVDADDTDMVKFIDFVGNVTNEIITEVQRLQHLGVRKILVNNMQPLGCLPWQNRPSNYSGECDVRSNAAANIHNDKLKSTLASDKNILVLDLYNAFSNIVDLSPDSNHEVSKQFKHKKMPCCESFDASGYCGQRGEGGEYLYTVCSNPDKYFYWDDVHPTEAGWKAVTGQLEDPIKKFLGLK